MLLKALFFLLLAGVALATVVFLLDRTLAAKTYKGKAGEHFDGAKFHNVGDGGTMPVINERPSALKWLLTREENEWGYRPLASTTVPASRVEGEEVVVTMINHASVLIQTAGLNILTDPTWSGRASPFSFVGPRRFQDAGVRFDDLPPIDVVLISHNHYDHLNIETLKRLQQKFNPKIFVPLGNALYLEERAISGAIEMDWWQKEAMNKDTALVLVPAQHFSARSISDRNITLWGGFVIETPANNFYFAGDTGYGVFVEEIAKKYPNGFKVGFVPIGAFMPRWFMAQVHTSPDDAMVMKKDLAIETLIPIHFGTFRLADDKQDEAEERLFQIAGGDSSVAVLKNGEFTILK